MSQASSLLPGTPVSGDWNPGNETDLYRFSASAGDRFYFDVLSSSFQGALSARWKLVDPYGNFVFDNFFGNSPALQADLPALSQPGTYTLLLEAPLSPRSTAPSRFPVPP